MSRAPPSARVRLEGRSGARQVSVAGMLPIRQAGAGNGAHGCRSRVDDVREKRMNRMQHGVIALVVVRLAAAPLQAEVVAGRADQDAPPTGMRVLAVAGRVTALKAVVKETTRPVFELEGLQYKYKYREDYSLEELGLDRDVCLAGVELERRWRFVTLRLEARYANPHVRGTAPRDFYIGVENVQYRGNDYEYMMIPEGRQYEADIQSGVMQFNVLITPVGLRSRSAWFTPWVQMGLFSIVGRYEIDAGRAEGLTTYENPPRTYVAGGKGSGWAGMVIPQVGVGAETRLVLARREAGQVSVALSADYGFMEFGGGTSDIGISSRHEKEVDLSYRNYGLRLSLDWPLRKGLGLLAGVQYRRMEADASITAKERAAEEVRVLREKYDKAVDFEMEWAGGFVGLRF